MHIEPGIVDGAKIYLSYATATAAAGLMLKAVRDGVREAGIAAQAVRSVLCTALVFCFFEVMPHYPVGVSEVHLILGTTLLLLFGMGAASLGLAAGLLLQGLFFAPFDLPQYGINVTTLLLPLFACGMLARKMIPAGTAYVDLSYAQTFKLSAAYQGGIVAWVAFWAFYGRGAGLDNLVHIASFGAAYMTVVIVEPLVDLAVLFAAKSLHSLQHSRLMDKRLYRGQV